MKYRFLIFLSAVTFVLSACQSSRYTTTATAPKPSAAAKENPFVNTLGMKFVPVKGTEVLFSIWHTRVQDFEAFVKATGHDATQGMYSLRSDGWMRRGDTWKDPGFTQGPTHPVCGVSWHDAQAFCKWLTEKERKDGIIDQQQSYRLPTDAEWSQAVGDTKYPWGDQWPPPQGAGNYADESSAVNPKKQGTSPVGSFRENKFGLYDLGGNLWGWCEDWYRADMNTRAFPADANDGGGRVYRVLRGASWFDSNPYYLLSSHRGHNPPGTRNGLDGFRCVLVGSSR